MLRANDNGMRQHQVLAAISSLLALALWQTQGGTEQKSRYWMKITSELWRITFAQSVILWAWELAASDPSQGCVSLQVFVWYSSIDNHADFEHDVLEIEHKTSNNTACHNVTCAKNFYATHIQVVRCEVRILNVNKKINKPWFEPLVFWITRVGRNYNNKNNHVCFSNELCDFSPKTVLLYTSKLRQHITHKKRPNPAYVCWEK